jgi:hypothetical protein
MRKIFIAILGFLMLVIGSASAQVQVEVDIKPGSCPNSFNGKSMGNVPVAIVGSDEFDVTTVDLTTITLEGVPALVEGVIEDNTQPNDDNTDCFTCFDADDPANFNCDLWDKTGDVPVEGTDGLDDSYCGGDGYSDLIVKFDTQALADAIGVADRNECVELELTGETYDGISIVGSDSVLIRTKIR